jgi:hypothetical protein
MLWSGKKSDRINEFCITFAQVSKSYGRDLEDMEMAGLGGESEKQSDQLYRMFLKWCINDHSTTCTARQHLEFWQGTCIGDSEEWTSLTRRRERGWGLRRDRGWAMS